MFDAEKRGDCGNSQKFRESNGFTNEVTKEFISRKFFFDERKFLVFPDYAAVTLFWQPFR